MVLAGLSGCIGMGNAMNFASCTMTSETLATAEGPGYRLDVVGAPVLCVDPAQSFDIWSHAGRLVVTNTGADPMVLVHTAGSNAVFSFAAETMADARNPLETIGYETGPIAAERQKRVEVTLAPGEAARVPGDPRYLLELVSRASLGQMLDGSAALADERFDRLFRITFEAKLQVTRGGVTAQVRDDLPTVLRIILRDPGSE
jgi:hypothetical protein